jgi:tetratricopeptide (TPR) repeat protein
MVSAAIAQENTTCNLTSTGYSFIYQLRYGEALNAFNDALAINPSWVAAIAGKGNALDHLGNSSGSLETYNRTVEIASYHVKAWVGKAQALENLNRSKQSL